jgi:hypothetical protein
MREDAVRPGRIVLLLAATIALVLILYAVGAGVVTFLESLAVGVLLVFVLVVSLFLRRKVREQTTPIIDLVPVVTILTGEREQRRKSIRFPKVRWGLRLKPKEEVGELLIATFPGELQRLHGLIKVAITRDEAYQERLRPVLRTLIDRRVERSGIEIDPAKLLELDSPPALLPQTARRRRLESLNRIITGIEGT